MKYILSIFILVLMSAWTQAQSFKGGFFGGLTASEVSGDNLAGPNKLGFSLGVYTALATSPNADIRMEMMYVQKGSKANPSEKNNFYTYRFHLGYVEVPILYHFPFPFFSSTEYMTRLKLEAGVSYARLMHYKEEDNGRLVLAGEKEAYHVNEANLLLGFNFPLNEKFAFNFRASSSITPIRPHQGKGTVWYNWGQYHTLWHLTMNYML